MICSATVAFARTLTQAELEPHLKAALIRLRHLTPSIALRVAKLPTNHYEVSYNVPKHLSEVEDWVNSILLFETEGDDRVTNHDNAARRWWRAKDNAYMMEFHLAPASSNCWTIT